MYDAASGVLKLLRMGHPILKQHAVPFKAQEILLPETRKLIKDMTRALGHYRGIGLAAPQIGVSKQLILLKIQKELPNITPIPLTILFNPRVEFILKHETIMMVESCLSIPNLVGKVPRYNNVIVNFLDEEARPRRLAANGFIAGVLQHETDHLLGILYPERLKGSKDLAYSEEWSEYMADDSSICMTGSAKFYDA